MALKATIRRAVKKAFLALDDVPKIVTYHSKTGTPVRDLDAGTFTLATVNVTVRMVAFTRFSQREVDKDPAILLTDSKVLFPTEDLGATQPQTADTLTDPDGTIWEIVRRLSDPASVVTILQVRTA